jgi:phosphotransferase system HPr (HPr) family protein
MPDAHVELALPNKEGLHARPSSLLVQAANRFQSAITLKVGNRSGDAKSIMEVMMLASPCGAVIELDATGPDAEEALEVLGELIRRGFGETMA